MRIRSRSDVPVASEADAGGMTALQEQTKIIPLGLKGRRTTLVVHIVSGGAWIGIDVMVAVLVMTGWFASDPTVRGLAYQTLGTWVVVPMLVSALVSLASGLLLGLGTRYGLLRYWWVAVKLVMNIILTVLIVFALRPQMPELVEHGRTLAGGGDSPLDVSTLFFPPAVSLTALTFATVLSVFKPWGRTRS